MSKERILYLDPSPTATGGVYDDLNGELQTFEWKLKESREEVYVDSESKNKTITSTANPRLHKTLNEEFAKWLLANKCASPYAELAKSAAHNKEVLLEVGNKIYSPDIWTGKYKRVDYVIQKKIIVKSTLTDEQRTRIFTHRLTNLCKEQKIDRIIFEELIVPFTRTKEGKKTNTSIKTIQQQGFIIGAIYSSALICKLKPCKMLRAQTHQSETIKYLEEKEVNIPKKYIKMWEDKSGTPKTKVDVKYASKFRASLITKKIIKSDNIADAICIKEHYERKEL